MLFRHQSGKATGATIAAVAAVAAAAAAQRQTHCCDMQSSKQFTTANTVRPGPAHVIRPRILSDTGVCCAASQHQVLVKVCGVTTAEDAQFAAQQGANLIGMIMWSKAKRAVSDETAAAIAAAARQHGAQAVGVFVDEDAETISRRCRAAGIPVAQLHGDASRAVVNQVPTDLQVVYVLQANDEGQIVTPLPGADSGMQLQRSIEWLLVDGMTGGSGKTFDWSNLQVPTGLASKGWLLAGGLNPSNVAQAVATAHPTAVDVSSGVCGPDGLAKDQSKVTAFISGAKQAATVAH